MRTIGLCLTLAVALGGAPAGQMVVSTAKGPIEFVGTEEWTPDRIQKELGYDSPDALHYCAADLKKRLGFPDAAVFTFRDASGQYKVITVVEPQHASLVRYRAKPSGTFALPPSWAPLVEAAGENHGQDFAFLLTRVARAHLRDGAVADVPWAAALRALSGAGERRLALEVLEHDSDRRHRMAAAAVLLNFSGEDHAWHGLIRAVRDPEDMVVATGMHALQALATHRSRNVDWSPVADDLRHILNGTSLFATRFVMEALIDTGVDASLAPRLLGAGGGHIVKAYLEAARRDDRDRAIRLLARLRGASFGDDAAAWRQWLAELE
jgi:hypothetical protein